MRSNTTAPKRSNAARLFGYDIFISFALGPPPRGSRSYASDLARRLRERDFTVFFSEEEAPVGDQLDTTLKRALHRSRILVVVVNSGTLSDPRWVRAEVEEFRSVHPQRPVIPINVGGGLQDPVLGPAAEPWLRFSDKIWIDESQLAGDEGIVSEEVLDRLATAPNAMRAGKRWRWTVRAAFVVLSLVTAAAVWFAWSDRQNANLAGERRVLAERNAADARRNAALARNNEARATTNAASAMRESRRAVAAEGDALHQAAAAQAAERKALSGRLAAEGQLARTSDPRAALLWAREAWNLEATIDARRALYEALHEPVPMPLAVVPSGISGSSVDYSSDGRFIAASGIDEPVIHLWDAETRRARAPLHAPAAVRQFAFSPDGRTLASADSKGRLQFWDPDASVVRGEPLVHADVASGSALAWSRDGRIVAFAGNAGDTSQRIVLWDVTSRTPIGEPLRPESKITNNVTFQLSFSDDGKRLAATVFNTIQVWNVATRQLIVPPIPTRPTTKFVAFLDNDTLAFDGPGYEATRWDLDNNHAVPPSFGGYSGEVGAFARAPSAKIVAISGDDMIRLWHDFPSPLRAPLKAHGGVEALAFNGDGSRLADVRADGQVTQWLLDTSDRFRRLGFRPPSRVGADMRISDDGHWLVLLRDSGRLEWHDEYAGGKDASVDGAGGDLLAVARDGSVALRADRVSLRRRGETRVRCTTGKFANDVVFSPDSRLLATWAIDDPSLRLWRASDCHPFATIPRNGDDLSWRPVAFSADNSSLLVPDRKTFHRWIIATRRFDDSAALGPADGTDIASDVRGRFVATAHGRGLIRLTRLGSNSPPVSLQGPHGNSTVRHLAFSPDGVWLASVADDGLAVLWDLTSNEPAGTPINTGQGQLRFVAFSQDSRTLVTSGTDGPPALWEVNAGAWAAEACLVAQRNLTCMEWQHVLGTQPYRKTCPALPLPEDRVRCSSVAH